MNRPRNTDPVVLERLRDSDQFISIVRSAILGSSETEVLASADDIIRCLRSHSSWDVYQFCYKLDQEGWAVDDSIYEMVESILSTRARIHREVIMEWVDKVFAVPPFPEGIEVTFKYRGTEYTGTVYDQSKEGKAYVKCERLGHVAEGKIGTQGVVIPWEDLQRWNSEQKV